MSEAGALEEIRLHLVPAILGAGTRLFEGGTPPNVRLRATNADTSPLAAHIGYELEADGRTRLPRGASGQRGCWAGSEPTASYRMVGLRSSVMIQPTIIAVRRA